MSDITTLIDRYVAMWNEPDAERRRELLTQVFSGDARYQGSPLEAAGHDGIETLARDLREHLPDHQFRRISEIDTHHGMVRYRWEILRPNGAGRFAAGTDVGEVGGDGRLRVVTVFLDQPPVLDTAYDHA